MISLWAPDLNGFTFTVSNLHIRAQLSKLAVLILMSATKQASVNGRGITRILNYGFFQSGNFMPAKIGSQDK